MLFPLYRGKVAFVVIVGSLVTVGLVAATGFYFLENSATDQAFKQEVSVKQSEAPITFNTPLSGSGVFNSDMIDVAKEEGTDKTESGADSDSQSQDLGYVLPKSTDWSEVPSAPVTSGVGVTSGSTTSDGSKSTIDPSHNAVIWIFTIHWIIFAFNVFTYF